MRINIQEIKVACRIPVWAQSEFSDIPKNVKGTLERYIKTHDLVKITKEVGCFTPIDISYTCYAIGREFEKYKKQCRIAARKGKRFIVI